MWTRVAPDRVGDGGTGGDLSCFRDTDFFAVVAVVVLVVEADVGYVLPPNSAAAIFSLSVSSLGTGAAGTGVMLLCVGNDTAAGAVDAVEALVVGTNTSESDCGFIP